MLTEKTEKYYKLLLELSERGDDHTREFYTATTEECIKLIQEFTKAELDYCITTTLWAWCPRREALFYQFLEVIFERGGDPNAIISVTETPPLFYATFRDDPKLLKFFIKWGADVKGHQIIKKSSGVRSFTIIEYMLYNWLWEGKPTQEKMIKILVKAGAPTEFVDFHGKMSGYNNRDKYLSFYNQVQLIIKNYKEKSAYKLKIREMQEYIDKLEGYIFELEHRPPELGGPEYEAGRKRWTTRNGIR